jgi:hypothetical protein
MGEAYYAENYLDINYNYVWAIGMARTNEIAHIGGPGWFHFRGTNFVFKDGHALSMKYTGQTLFDADFIQK